jgi:hypothetical protein
MSAVHYDLLNNANEFAPIGDGTLDIPAGGSGRDD